jgi:uncharacterized protein
MMLDTAGLFALMNAAEREHADAVRLFATGTNRFTHSFVFDELVPLARRRGFPVDVVLAVIEQLLVEPSVDVVWVDQPLVREGIGLLRARPDKEYSLCDAVSFVLMYRRGVYEALTTDHHFEQEGFTRLLK